MHQQIVTAVGIMGNLRRARDEYDPVIYCEFDSNSTNSFLYIVPSCDTIEAIRDCFTAVNTPITAKEKKFKASTLDSDIFTTATKDLAELFFFYFINICYREEYPIV